MGFAVIYGHLTQRGLPRPRRHRLQGHLAFPTADVGQVRLNSALHETRQIVYFVNDNDGIIKKAVAICVGRIAGIFLQLGGANAVIVNECNRVVDLVFNLLHDLFSLGSAQRLEIRLERVIKIGNPDS